MQYIKKDVVTIAIGLAASMGQFLLTAGTPGKRFALPNAEMEGALDYGLIDQIITTRDSSSRA